MKILKYQAGSMRQALAQIKDELGDDAMVVSTRPMRRGLLGNGIEVSVAIDVDEESGISEPQPKTNHKVGLNDADVERIMAPLRSELRSLRSLLRATASTKANGDDVRREIAAMRRAFESLNNGSPLPKPDRSLEDISQTGSIVAPSKGRIVALVGPTGVGKTTTIAKLAARAVYEAQEATAIITLDTFRIGGEEQMRVYANLIGAPLFIVADPADLPAQVEALAAYDRVFIDTAGHSLRDVPSLKTLRSALESVADLEIHMTLALSTPTNVIDANYEQYRKVGVNRLIFTKLDESIDYVELLKTPERLNLPISYITTGPAVPEDIEAPTVDTLLEYARHPHDRLPEAA